MTKCDRWVVLLHARFAGLVTAVLLAVPLVAGAVVAVMIKKGYAALTHGMPLNEGDWQVGVPLAAVLGVAVAAILVRSYQVYCGANSQWVWAFRSAPWIALLGAAAGLAANAGRL